jgi:hypothetical protein
VSRPDAAALSPAQAVTNFLDALARLDPAAALAVVDPQAEVTVHPLGIHGTGADLLGTVLADLTSAFPDLLLSVHRVIATGAVVTALIKVEASTRRSTWISTRPGGSRWTAARSRR